MKRMTTKFADKVVLPMIPISPYYDLSELDKFHEVRRKYEEFAIKLAEYEDIGTIKEFNEMKEKLKLAKEWLVDIADFNENRSDFERYMLKEWGYER